jgi:photosystem II stability/assembly factor-like uncharacterized protein
MHPEEFGIEAAQISGKYLPAKYFKVHQARRSIRSLVTSPSQTLYAGTDIGIYRSQDKGKSWLQINQGLFDQNIHSLIIDPKDPNTIYAGTGKGVFKSEDAGDTWSDWFDESTGLTHSNIHDLVLHPDNSDILFAATNGGIFQSLDAGESWEPIFTEHPAQIIRISASNPDILYTSGNNGTFRSKNRGIDWSPVWKNTLPDKSTSFVSLNTEPEFLYSGTSTGLHKSFNGGRNWVQDPTFKKSSIDSIYINSFNLSKIFVGRGGDFFSSKDGGDSWKNISSLTPNINGRSGTSIDLKITEISRLNEKTLFIGTTSGLYFSGDEGKSWNHIDLSGAVNQLSPDEMKMDVVKLVTEIHTGRFFGSYFFMLVDLATLGIVFLVISGILIAFYRARIKNRKKLADDTEGLVTDRVIERTETTNVISTESQEIHDMIAHITEHIEKCQLVYMDQEKKEIDEISRHLNILDKKMHSLMENLGELEKTSED